MHAGYGLLLVVITDMMFIAANPHKSALVGPMAKLGQYKSPASISTLSSTLALQ